MLKTRTIFLVAFLIAALPHCMVAQTLAKHRTAPTPEYSFKIVHSFPHDSSAFTEGLAFRDGFLYEGTGILGRSSLRKVRLETGEVIQRIDLAPEYFGEGITLYKSEIVQLTWLSQTGFVYDGGDFRRLRQFSYQGEGWGLATNASEIFMSDGTPEIRVLDASTLSEKRRFTVRDGGKKIDQLNELEFVEGEIFANVWQADRIARISPLTGKVLGWIDLQSLLSPCIAWSLAPCSTESRMIQYASDSFVAGKLWPLVFEIRIIPGHANNVSNDRCARAR